MPSRKSFTGKIALVTGGSSGIGLEMARLLAAEGASLWLLARDPRKLAAACTALAPSAPHPGQFIDSISVDVSSSKSVHAAAAQVLSRGAPDLLVNCAGITYPGEFDDLPLERFRELMEINYFGTLYVIKAFLPAMLQRGSGAIVNVSSLAGLHGLYGYSAYSASKFALSGLTDALRYELKPRGIQVSIAFPSDTQTPQLAFEEPLKPPVLRALTESNNKPVPPQQVAQSILDGVRKGRYFILPTADSRLLYAVTRLFPGEGLYRLVDGLMAQARRKVAKDNRR
jgi:3-dehydrosphinganine reductase